MYGSKLTIGLMINKMLRGRVPDINLDRPLTRSELWPNRSGHLGLTCLRLGKTCGNSDTFPSRLRLEDHPD